MKDTELDRILSLITPSDRVARVEEYYFSKKLDEVRRLNSSGASVINLGIGSPDLAPSRNAIAALDAAANNPANHGYQSYRGTPALRKGIADFYDRTYSVSLDAETMVLPLMGSKEGIFHVAMAFVNEGDEVLIPDPGYPTYASAAKLSGAKIRTYKMEESLEWGVDVQALRSSDLSRVKIMWINFPHMPTGRVASREELTELVNLARARHFLIVNDNPYSLILNDAPISILSIDGADEVAVELNSLSKSHNMAGWRIGWAAGRKEYIDAILRVKSNMDSGMFLGLQQAAVEALKNDEVWFRELNATYAERKIAACAVLDELGCRYSSRQSGLFVWAKAPDEVADVEKWVDELLYGANVFITPGFIFGEGGRRYVRISLCAPVETLREAAIRVRKFTQSKGDMVSSAGKPGVNV